MPLPGRSVEPPGQLGAGIKPRLSPAGRAVWLGLFRLVTFVPVDPDLPVQQQHELAAYYASTRFADRMFSVYRQFPNLLAQARGVRDLGDVPLMAVVGGANDNTTGVLRDLQDELLALSSNSQQCIVEGATHISLVHNPVHASETSAAIPEIVTTVRADRRG